jgi:hypothetical protein
MKPASILGAALLAAGLIVLQSAGAEDLYDLQGPPPVKGQVFAITTKSVGKDMKRIIKTSGKTIEEKFDEVGTKRKEAEVLAVAGGEITLLRTKIFQDQREETVRRGKSKKEAKRVIDRDLQGQFIYSERAKDGWQSFLEDAVPTDKQKTELKEYVPFKEEDIFYPKGKFKVGHAWKVDKAELDKVFGRQFQDIKGGGEGRFIRVEKQDGEDVAVIELDLELTGKTTDDGLTLDVSIKAKGTSFRSLKYGFDRKSTSLINLRMKGGGEDDGQKIELEYTGTLNDEDKVELKSKGR